MPVEDDANSGFQFFQCHLVGVLALVDKFVSLRSHAEHEEGIFGVDFL